MRSLTVLCITILAILAVSPAHAGITRNNVVIFGDSMVADPLVSEVIAGRLSGQPHCPHSPTSYAEIAAKRLSLESRNFSCAGAQVHMGGPFFKTSFIAQIDTAIATGALDPNTRRVWITQGFNDTWSGHPAAQVIATMNEVIGRIRAHAPNARIQIVGYPKITHQGQLCLVRLPGQPAWPIAAGVVAAWEDQALSIQREVAAATGSELIDVRSATANHSMCAPDEQRYISSVVDAAGAPRHLPAHVNERGHQGIADLIVRMR
ncbi:SGNH/GDSL hydrolase family protein [Corynebacterium rouxii]|uniref:SGNH/GDSL hydrolase family protein n=1 Tax=Corynebacterium rouxii TaxID=2719119 RepID=UPI00313B9F46